MPPRPASSGPGAAPSIGAAPGPPHVAPPGPPLPSARGPLSAAVLEALGGAPRGGVVPFPEGAAEPDDPLGDEDLQLALYVCYELHYRGFDGVDEDWEWDPGLLGLRARLERGFESALRDAVGPLEATGDVAAWLRDLVAGDDGGESLSAWCAEHATLEHVREEAVLRSLYQRKEADPHSFQLPRLDGEVKAALVHIQAAEYGHGVAEDAHAELFSLTMSRLGLDPRYGYYLDRVPATTLATVNLVSMVGLHRRLRGATIGHLALFEMASVPVMSDHDAALRRLGFDHWTRLFYTTHVVADADHQTVAADRLAGTFADGDPAAEREVMFGASALARLEARATEHVLGAWRAGRSCLRTPLPDDLPAPGRDEPYVAGEDPRR